MIGPVVYVLCTLASLGCALLLGRTYRRNGVRLLLWSSLAFVALAVNNALVFVDLVLLPAVDLFYLREAASLAAACLFLFGLIWESE